MSRSRASKRAFDIALASVGLVLSSPVTLAIWARIKLDRDGPALYAGRRVGRDGREFRMYKFRTMVTNA
ncbi:MAG TPA: sugar transferase, partial [Candidatus Angelobacter sp.]|nr:sugar transferase [Candidatus Angelobacter sp.]